ANSSAHTTVSTFMANVTSSKSYLAIPLRNEPNQRLDQRCLARPIGPEQHHRFPLMDGQRHLPQRLDLTVAGIHILCLQQFSAHPSDSREKPPPPACRELLAT